MHVYFTYLQTAMPPVKAHSASAEGWAAVAEGQTEPLKAAKGRASSELRYSPTRPKGGAAPNKNSIKPYPSNQKRPIFVYIKRLCTIVEFTKENLILGKIFGLNKD